MPCPVLCWIMLDIQRSVTCNRTWSDQINNTNNIRHDAVTSKLKSRLSSMKLQEPLTTCPWRNSRVQKERNVGWAILCWTEASPEEGLGIRNEGCANQALSWKRMENIQRGANTITPFSTGGLRGNCFNAKWGLSQGKLGDRKSL